MSAFAGVVRDPSAGVTLWPGRVLCPRCGFDKGTKEHAKPGLCRDCSSGMTQEERTAWRSTVRSGGRKPASLASRRALGGVGDRTTRL